MSYRRRGLRWRFLFLYRKWVYTVCRFLILLLDCSFVHDKTSASERILKEGLVNVRTLNMTSENAFPALVDKLSSVRGVTIIHSDKGHHALSIGYDEQVAEDLCNVLTTFLFSDWLFAWLRLAFNQEYRHLSDDEIEYLTLVLVHEVRADELVLGNRSFAEWYARTKAGMRAVLTTGKALSMEGVARFRLRWFLKSVTAASRERVQQFLLDREYEESVAMLRYLLETQPETAQELHVFSAPDRVWITDATGRLVRDSEVTEAALSESTVDLNSEDLAMSILITRSPCKIVLHDMNEGAQWPSFAETLGRVFAERVQKCNHCSTCQQLKQAQYILPVDTSSDYHLKRNH
ncbi:sporulation protein YtxC [Alicyclobacillus suci]|uniref:sporulation protein YtxC n=1 Tax=Alicyclobacillus suci TaxID=2816080 RepID=UPI00166283AE|nr:sporulation protein YtxC [Alicyclobacillus suci]